MCRRTTAFPAGSERSAKEGGRPVHGTTSLTCCILVQFAACKLSLRSQLSVREGKESLLEGWDPQVPPDIFPEVVGGNLLH